MEKLFFELIQVSLGNLPCLSAIPSAEEWKSIYMMAQKQALIGVCFCGVQRLQSEQVVQLPHELKLRWLVLSEKIRLRNELINRRVWRFIIFWREMDSATL